MAKSEFTTEQWKVIPEFPNYEISTLGRIRRCTPVWNNRSFIGKIIKTRIEKRNRYVLVKLRHEGLVRQVRVHILVAEAFLDPRPTPKHEVNHKDGVKANCVKDNLEWMTRSENLQHAAQLGLIEYRRGEDCPASKITEDAVREIRKLISEKKLKHREIGQRFGLSRPQVSSIGRRDCWKHIQG